MVRTISFQTEEECMFIPARSVEQKKLFSLGQNWVHDPDLGGGSRLTVNKSSTFELFLFCWNEFLYDQY